MFPNAFIAYCAFHYFEQLMPKNEGDHKDQWNMKELWRMYIAALECGFEDEQLEHLA